MTKLNYFRLVCLFTLVLVINIIVCAQSSSEKDQKMFDIGVTCVLDKSSETELFGVDFKLIDVRRDSTVKSGEATQQWEEQGRTVKTSSFRISSGAIKILPLLLEY